MPKSFTPLFYIGLCLIFLMISLKNGYTHESKGFDTREPVCLKTYPTDPSLFNETVAPYVEKIIDRHGLEEWKATLLTRISH